MCSVLGSLWFAKEFVTNGYITWEGGWPTVAGWMDGWMDGWINKLETRKRKRFLLFTSTCAILVGLQLVSI
jgi:hypothetical protein